MANRLYVGNLAFHSTEDTIRAAFEALGPVSDVHVVLDRMSGQSRGFAFVTMISDDDAQRAIASLNGTVVDGRPLRVDQAEERIRHSGTAANGKAKGAPER